MVMAKKKNKKRKFLKRHHEKLERQRRHRQKSIKNISSPIKQLRSMSAEDIKYYLEDSPLLRSEKEFEDFSFSVDLVEKYTNSVYEKYQELFDKAKDKSIKKKKSLYEDFCLDVCGKLVNKPLLVSLKRRLKLASTRLKEAGNNEQLKRAVVTEATLSVPQIPIEAHPFVVGMYEDVRKVAMKDFTIPGFEEVMFWQDRVAFEREEEKTVSGTLKDEAAALKLFEDDDRFEKVEADTGTAFRWLISVPSEKDKTVEPQVGGLLTIVNQAVFIKTESATMAEEAKTVIESLLGDLFEVILENDDEESSENETSDVTEIKETKSKKKKQKDKKTSEQ